MLRNSLPNLTKENILAVRETYGTQTDSRATRFQILPVPSYLIDKRWHRVYQGRHRFVEARGGVMLVTARLEALHEAQEKFRVSRARYMAWGEALDVMTDPRPPEHDGNPYRIPTPQSVLFRPAMTAWEQSSPKAPKPYWRRIYWTKQGTWLFIEVRRLIFTEAERAADPHGTANSFLRRYQGIVRIAYPYDVLSRRLPTDETIIQD